MLCSTLSHRLLPALQVVKLALDLTNLAYLLVPGAIVRQLSHTLFEDLLVSQVLLVQRSHPLLKQLSVTYARLL